MRKLKLGILGTADIAFRRFLPSLIESDLFDYVGIASRNYRKTVKFIENFGGKGYKDYDSLLDDEEIDAVYIPLPPSLHFEWALKALNKGKHIFVEKPLSISKNNTLHLIETAKRKNLAIHENYMFIYHNQLNVIKKIVEDGKIGEIRLFRSAFGFPKRSPQDFRYIKELGGGSLFDCGGYPVKLATFFLGDTAVVKFSKLFYTSEFDVDIYGCATLTSDNENIFQIAFGMDNSYKCELEIWGSKGNITATRIFTSGRDFNPVIRIEIDSKTNEITVPPDDHFKKSIQIFYNLIVNEKIRDKHYNSIIKQASLIEDIYLNGVKNNE